MPKLSVMIRPDGFEFEPVRSCLTYRVMRNELTHLLLQPGL